jgi:putative ribosome biogenesis GTPase RsgA
MAFKSCKSSTAVTTDFRMKFFPGLNIMDTPGFNDPKKERSDNKILEELVSILQTNPDCEAAGIGSLLQCVMVP